ncbi:MAG: hypothetical protein EAZ14_12795, partial [Runella slithyformis]
MSLRLFPLWAVWFLLIFGNKSHAQTYSFKWDNAAQMTLNGKTLRNPWAGGINSGQYSKMHLNDD